MAPHAPLIALFVLLTCCTDALAQQAGRRTGDVVARFDFQNADALEAWEPVGEGSARIDPSGGGRAVVAEIPAAAGAGSFMLCTPLPLDRVRGTRLNFTARASATDVAEPQQSYNGVKFMLHTTGPDGPAWHNASDLWGTFDAKPISFSGAVPADATEAWLIVGLQDTHGRATFDDIRVTIGPRQRTRPAEPTAPDPDDPSFLAPRLRGAMVDPYVTPEDLRDLAGWGANVIRYQLFWTRGRHEDDGRHDLEKYDAWLDERLDHLDTILPVCRELGLYVVLDLHTTPGGAIMIGEWPLFQEKRFQDHFLVVWDRMARRYKDNDVIWGYDIANEPVEGVVAEGLMDWQALALEAARVIRAIDPDRTLIIEPAMYGSPDGLDWLEPLPLDNVVYSCHMYAPHAFTHQGVHGPSEPITYPGTINGQHVDKAWLRRALRPAIGFQHDYGVRMYIGEFSAIRWAPDDSAARYLRDCIEIFEEEGWDWTYHAFREWDGWSAEHGTDKGVWTPAPEMTERERLLRDALSKNERPTFE